MNFIIFNVRVKPLVAKKRLHVEDCDIAGEYDIHLPAEAAQWSSARQAKEVLDRFHNSIPIAVLDDFEISVFDSMGTEIFEEWEE